MKETPAQLIQSLDSSWFFCNVFSSSKTKPNVQSFEGIEDTEKPNLSILHSDRNESTVNPETEPKSEVSILGIDIEEAAEIKNSRRKKKRRRRKILGEIDLGVENDIDWGLNYEAGEKLKLKWGGSGSGSSKEELVKMPPLSDGMAMKEHLKSWAYAVACTVR